MARRSMHSCGMGTQRGTIVSPHVFAAQSRLTSRVGLLLASTSLVLFSVPSGFSGGPSSHLALAAGPPSLQDNSANAAEPAKNVDWAALLPEGEGRLETTVYCTTCHSIQTIIEKRRMDESGWKDAANRMVFSNDAVISEEDIGIISHYLAQHFGPGVPTFEFPVNVNSSSKEMLQLLPGMTAENVEKLLEARKRAKISDSSQLEAILGKETVDKIKQLVSFD